jgi:hypothetical protein
MSDKIMGQDSQWYFSFPSYLSTDFQHATQRVILYEGFRQTCNRAFIANFADIRNSNTCPVDDVCPEFREHAIGMDKQIKGLEWSGWISDSRVEALPERS